MGHEVFPFQFSLFTFQFALMNHWLMKSEPSAYSIDDLKRDKTTNWNGIRNYQARNYMRDEMKAGDKVLFYASSADPSGVTGLAEVVREGYPEKEEPWVMVDLRFLEKFPEIVPLETLKKTRGLETRVVTNKDARPS